MTFLFTILILAALGGLVWAYRNEIEGFMPGVKTKAWNTVLILVGLLGWFSDYTGMIPWSQFLSAENAALAALVVGFVGVLLSWVTRRLDKNHDGIVDERDQEEALD